MFLNLINNACESMTEFEQTLQQRELSEPTKVQQPVTSQTSNKDSTSYKPPQNSSVQPQIVVDETENTCYNIYVR